MRIYNEPFAQTPSFLQEWQYSAGIDLIKLFVPSEPTWQTMVGVAVDYRAFYEGAKTYRLLAGPVADVRYKDLAFSPSARGSA